MQWQDADGLNTNGNGEAGSLTLSGLHLGSHKGAITQDNLTWPYHMSDLGGWQSAGAQTYGVRFIPQAFLIDAEGKIIAKDLRGPELLEKMAELFPGV